MKYLISNKRSIAVFVIGIVALSIGLISIYIPNLQTGTIDHKGVRSLNLSVACGIAIYEAHKQINSQNGN